MNPKQQSKTSPVPARTNLSSWQPGHPGRDENGFIIIAVIALVAILALVGTVAVMTTTTEIKISSNYKTRTQAFYIAEAGAHRAIGMLNDATTDWINNIDKANAFPGPDDNSLGNGTYLVEISEDDPTTGSVLITSTGSASTSSSTVETVVTKQYYDILLNYAMFDCGDIVLKGGVTNTISGGDVYVDGTLDLEANGVNIIEDGDVYSMVDIVINGTSRITNGNAFANGNIDLQSSASPNIGGNATAKGSVSGSGTVSGTTTQGASPDPVPDLCNGTDLADITMPSEDIQDLRDNATDTYVGNFTFDDNVNYTGIVYITGNFTLAGDATFSDNVVFIIDGNVEITGSLTSASESSVTFIVPNGDFEVLGVSGDYTIDGVLLVGTVNEDGSGASGGNIDVRDGANLTINGTAIAVNGNTDASNGGELTINYQSPNDSNLMEPNSYKMTQWREIRN